MGAIKKGKAAKHLHKSRKLEEQKPLLTIHKVVDKPSPKLG